MIIALSILLGVVVFLALLLIIALFLPEPRIDFHRE